VEMAMWRTANSTLVWLGSILHVMAPRSPRDLVLE
jgi:hypothetical protein